MQLGTETLLVARQVCRNWRQQASLQITAVTCKPGDQLEPCLALLQKLASLRSVCFFGKEPTMLFHLEALARLTCLGLPAPTSSELDGVFNLLGHLPELKALAVGADAHFGLEYTQIRSLVLEHMDIGSLDIPQGIKSQSTMMTVL
ncbi:hypothetical protein WJX73_007069 [Symbiochloris irregularis]|uniref:Uncharacterized protein n=1 Tax=Symbiochloris irregularis TaxID=706552 RepID=A0AAW1NYV7_9CHLO